MRKLQRKLTNRRKLVSQIRNQLTIYSYNLRSDTYDASIEGFRMKTQSELRESEIEAGRWLLGAQADMQRLFALHRDVFKEIENG